MLSDAPARQFALGWQRAENCLGGWRGQFLEFSQELWPRRGGRLILLRLSRKYIRKPFFADTLVYNALDGRSPSCLPEPRMDNAHQSCGCHPGQCKQQSVSLASLREGQTAVVCAAMTADMPADDAAYVRALGLRPSAFVRVCRVGQPCIVEVMAGASEDSACCRDDASLAGSCSCRIGLSRELAQHVMVEVAR